VLPELGRFIYLFNESTLTGQTYVITLRPIRRAHVMAKIISYWPFTVEVRV